MEPIVRIGTAGWGIPKTRAESFSKEGSQLERYARVFNCVEINSTFYRSHRETTYERWSAGVPPEFAFAVKLSREITHVRKLRDCAELAGRFVDETAALGSKREVILVQLPPKLAYDPAVAHVFFETMRRAYGGRIALEPRHPSWFAPNVATWLASIDVSRVAADPAVVPEAANPAGSGGLAYFRWHGSPDVYRSSYPARALETLARRFAGAPNVWCVFDNTASGAATTNALDLAATVRARQDRAAR